MSERDELIELSSPTPNENNAVSETEPLIIDVPDIVIGESPVTESVEAFSSVVEDSITESVEVISSIGTDIKSLASVFQLIVTDSPSLSKYKIDILPKHKAVFDALLKDKTYFANVEDYLKRIISDDKIDARDVPMIMLLLTELYERLHTLSLKDIDTATCGDLLKIVVEVAIREGVVPVSQNDIELLSCIFAIVDTSIRLIQTKNPLDKLKKSLSDESGLVACIARYICHKK